MGNGLFAEKYMINNGRLIKKKEKQKTFNLRLFFPLVISIYKKKGKKEKERR